MTDTQAIGNLTVRYRDNAFEALDGAADKDEWIATAKQYLQYCVNKLKAADGGDPNLPDIPEVPS